MKRKLITHEVLESIKNSSLSASEIELKEATPILAKALAIESLNLVSYGPEAALFETKDGTYVHTGWKINESGYITFDNIEQLAVDSDSEKEKAKSTVSLMLDAILEDNRQSADQLFDSYLNLPSVRRVIKESAKHTKKEKKHESKFAKKFLKKGKAVKSAIGKCGKMCENVMAYVNSYKLGPVIKESSINQDNSGNVVAVKIPASTIRNEAKVLSFNWKTMATDLKVLRSGAKKLSENMEFCKAVGNLKRQNAVSDAAALEEALETIVGKWPSVLYLTQDELSSIVKEALETIDAKNYDDKTCEFMSEGILRTAHNVYTDKVSKILTLSNTKPCTECKDKYPHFKETVENYFSVLDESSVLEMQVFVDLYEALRGIYDAAGKDGDAATATETAVHLNELKSILEQHVAPSIEVAEAAAEWLNYLIETNLETSAWTTDKTPVISGTGEHPDLEKWAKHSYSPAADHSGKASVGGESSDGKTMSSADDVSWGDKDIYPDLQNPYLLHSEVPTMKGEKGVDKDDNGVNEPGKDMWPELENPYVGKSIEPKLNQGKETDTV